MVAILSCCAPLRLFPSYLFHLYLPSPRHVRSRNLPGVENKKKNRKTVHLSEPHLAYFIFFFYNSVGRAFPWRLSHGKRPLTAKTPTSVFELFFLPIFFFSPPLLSTYFHTQWNLNFRSRAKSLFPPRKTGPELGWHSRLLYLLFVYWNIGGLF